jgi:hypothetical protein
MNDSHVFRGFGPRSTFYSARDMLLANPETSKTALVGEQSTRQQLVNEAMRATELLITSLRSAKPFDDLGNVELTVPQIEEARSNALLRVNNLLEAIERTNSRVRKHRNAEYATDVRTAIIGEAPAGEAVQVQMATVVPSPADIAALSHATANRMFKRVRA